MSVVRYHRLSNFGSKNISCIFQIRCGEISYIFRRKKTEIILEAKNDHSSSWQEEWSTTKTEYGNPRRVASVVAWLKSCISPGQKHRCTSDENPDERGCAKYARRSWPARSVSAGFRARGLRPGKEKILAGLDRDEPLRCRWVWQLGWKESKEKSTHSCHGKARYHQKQSHILTRIETLNPFKGRR